MTWKKHTIWFSRFAAPRPVGPAPMTRTSTSLTKSVNWRSGMCWWGGVCSHVRHCVRVERDTGEEGSVASENDQGRSCSCACKGKGSYGVEGKRWKSSTKKFEVVLRTCAATRQPLRLAYQFHLATIDCNYTDKDPGCFQLARTL